MISSFGTDPTKCILTRVDMRSNVNLVRNIMDGLIKNPWGLDEKFFGHPVYLDLTEVDPTEDYRVVYPPKRDGTSISVTSTQQQQASQLSNL